MTKKTTGSSISSRTSEEVPIGRCKHGYIEICLTCLFEETLTTPLKKEHLYEKTEHDLSTKDSP